MVDEYWIRIIAGSYFGVSMLFFLPVSCWWVFQARRYRNLSFISKRGAKFIFISSASLVLASTLPLISIVFACTLQLGDPNAYDIIEVFVMAGLSILYSNRFFRAYYGIIVRQINLDWAWHKDLISTPGESFWVKYSRYLKNVWWSVGGTFLLVAMFLVASFIIAFLTVGPASNYGTVVWKLVFMAFVTMLMLFMLQTISKCHDLYRFREEFIYITLFGVGSWFILEIVSMTAKILGEKRLSVLFSWIGVHWNILFCIYFGTAWLISQEKKSDEATEAMMIRTLSIASQSGGPAIASRGSRQQSRHSTSRSRTSAETPLLLVLTDVRLFRGFATQLLTEYSCENLLFIVEILQFQEALRTIVDRMPQKCKQQIELRTEITNYDQIRVTAVGNILEIDWLPKHPVFLDFQNRRDNVIAMVKYLIDKYIDNLASLCVNISGSVRTKLMNDAKSAESAVAFAGKAGDANNDLVAVFNAHSPYMLFDRAFREVWSLLVRGPFSRFRRSVDFLEIVPPSHHPQISIVPPQD